MHDILRPVRQAQDHIMILAAVKTGTEQFCPVKQFSVKHAEMTDIIIRPQIINGKIRLKMHSQHFVQVAALKSGLITVEIIRIFLIDGLHIFKQNRRMQQIVMVKKADILPCGQLQAFIGIF